GEATQQYMPSSGPAPLGAGLSVGRVGAPGEGYLPEDFLKGATVIDELRLGSLGRVLIVECPEGAAHDKLVLRLLDADDDEGEESVRLLREDASALAGVEHAGLVPVLGVTRRGNEEFVVLAFPSGKALPALLSRQELDPDRAMSLACRCASGLGELARAGRPHRDFRSSSVFVSEDDSVQILPLACPPECRVEGRVAEGGVYRGLARYAAPELHSSGGGSPTERSNIFAFGVVLYEMLTGQTPFVGGTPSRVLLNIQEAQPSPPRAVNKPVADKLDRICLRCLEKDPEQRHRSFVALEAGLRVSSVRAVAGQDRRAAPPSASGRASGRPDDSAEAHEPRAAPATSSRTTKRASAMRVPSGRAGLSGAHKGILVAGGVLVLAGVGLVAALGLGGKSGESEKPGTSGKPGGAARDDRAGKVFAQVEKLVSLDRHEAALALIEAHAAIRPSDPERYDKLFRQTYLTHWRRRAARAEGDGRWSDAAEAFTALLKHETGVRRESAETRLAEAAYRSELARADSALVASEWATAVEALEKADGLASGEGAAYRAAEPERERLRAELTFARSLRDAGLARAKGDRAGERKHLLDAARQRPDHEATSGRLRELGADPRAAEEALARARKALGVGDLDATEGSIKEAARLWPLDERPPRVLAYLADRRSIERTGMAFVSDSDPFVAWGPEERARAFGIDRYEFPGVAGRMPRTAITWAEAARACRERGGRLCTLAEWQLAAAGPKGLKYPYGNTYDADAANTRGTGLVASGSFKKGKSPFGVHDMSGNAGEWTADERDGGRVVAGGDWSSGAAGSKSTSFIVFGAELTSPRVGFRCCRPLVPGAEARRP
ncbi:MAG: protein kinase, partial [Planctomycetota bacterium]